jgi:hypothetical protein
MNVRAKVGAMLVAAGCLVAPSAFWLWPSLLFLYIGIAVTIAGFAVLLWSRSKAGMAEAIGAGGPDAPGSVDAPD